MIGVLFFRFRIDQNIIDLKDSLAQKKEIVQAVTPLLKRHRGLTSKAQLLERRYQQEHKLVALNYILSVFQKQLFDHLSINDTTFTIKGTSTDPRQWQLFYTRLQADKYFKTVTLSNIRRVNEGYVFDLLLDSFIKHNMREAATTKQLPSFKHLIASLNENQRLHLTTLFYHLPFRILSH